MPQLTKAYTRATNYIKMFIGASCDIIFLCLNMRIEAKGESYDMDLKNQDFESKMRAMKKIPKLCNN